MTKNQVADKEYKKLTVKLSNSNSYLFYNNE